MHTPVPSETSPFHSLPKGTHLTTSLLCTSSQKLGTEPLQLQLFFWSCQLLIKIVKRLLCPAAPLSRPGVQSSSVLLSTSTPLWSGHAITKAFVMAAYKQHPAQCCPCRDAAAQTPCALALRALLLQLANNLEGSDPMMG